MDEKKNVGFIPGLALILAVLALVLISINAVKPTPTEETMEKAINAKIEALAKAVAAEVKAGDEVNRQVSNSLLKRDLENAAVSVNAFATTANPELAQEILNLQNAIKALQDRINGAPAPAAPAAPPAPAN